jgi:hypothetical protein
MECLFFFTVLYHRIQPFSAVVSQPNMAQTCTIAIP